VAGDQEEIHQAEAQEEIHLEEEVQDLAEDQVETHREAMAPEDMDLGEETILEEVTIHQEEMVGTDPEMGMIPMMETDPTPQTRSLETDRFSKEPEAKDPSATTPIGIPTETRTIVQTEVGQTERDPGIRKCLLILHQNSMAQLATRRLSTSFTLTLATNKLLRKTNLPTSWSASQGNPELCWELCLQFPTRSGFLKELSSS
jgi:hypothetical protein